MLSTVIEGDLGGAALLIYYIIIVAVAGTPTITKHGRALPTVYRRHPFWGLQSVIRVH
jgi:hypothetical protein